MSCKVEWISDDLEDMISRTCKNYDKLTKESLENFNFNLELMNKTLEDKQTNIEKIE